MSAETAKRILAAVPPWDKDDSKTPEELIEEIQNTDPETIINYLLDIIEG